MNIQSKPPREDLESMLEDFKALRLEARGLVRSGNPAVRAEGVKHLAHAEGEIRWIKHQLAKEA